MSLKSKHGCLLLDPRAMTDLPAMRLRFSAGGGEPVE